MIKTSQMLIAGFSLLLLGFSFEIPQATAETPPSKIEKKMEIKWGKPTDGVVCAATLKQASIDHNAGQPIEINLHTKNIGLKDVAIGHDPVLSLFEFHVIDPNNKQTPFTSYGYNNGGSPGDGRGGSGKGSTKLKPKTAVHHDNLWLNLYFDMTLPGTYQVSFKRIIYIYSKKSRITVTSNTLQIKVIEPVKVSVKAKPIKSQIKWGKPVKKITCAVSTNAKNNVFYFKSPIWVNLHAKTSPKLSPLAGEYEVSVLAPYQKFGSEHMSYTKGKWNPMPLTLYGMQKTKGKDKSTLHITLKPIAKEDFVRLHLSRYFDMTMFSDEGYKVSFKRKLKLPKQKKTITIQSNTLLISNKGNTKPKK